MTFRQRRRDAKLHLTPFRIALVVCTLGWRSATSQALWIPIDSTHIVTSASYYAGSARRVDQIVSVWMKLPSPAFIIVDRSEIDCRRRMTRLMDVDVYDTSGTYKFSKSDGPSRWESIAAFIDTAFARKLCDTASSLTVTGPPITRYTLPPVRTRWQYVTRALSGDTVSVDAESVERSGSVVSVWLKYRYIKPPQADSRIVSSTDRVQFDCRKHLSRGLSSTTFDSTGQPVQSYNTPMAWAPTIPESIFEEVGSLVCHPGPMKRFDPPMPLGPPPKS